MTLYINSDTYYLSVSEGRSLAGEFLFLGTQPKDANKPPTVLPDTNGTLYIECSTMRSVMVLAMESMNDEV